MLGFAQHSYFMRVDESGLQKLFSPHGGAAHGDAQPCSAMHGLALHSSF
jgi:hypothetical protein